MVFIHFLGLTITIISLQALDRSKLSDALNEKDFTNGQKIFAQGEVGHEMYFILEGKVSIVRTNDQVSMLLCFF